MLLFHIYCFIYIVIYIIHTHTYILVQFSFSLFLPCPATPPPNLCAYVCVCASGCAAWTLKPRLDIPLSSTPGPVSISLLKYLLIAETFEG